MIKTKYQEFKERSQNMSVKNLIETIEKEEINYGDILADKLSDQNVLNKWLFDHKKVSTFSTQYKRNAEGRMEGFLVESGKVRPTSDGKAQLIYLLKMARKYDSEKLANVANYVTKMLIEDAINEGHYFRTDASGKAAKVVVSHDFSEVLENYLQLPDEMIWGSTLLKFLQNDSISSTLNKKDGYIALKMLTSKDRKYDVDELKKIVGYVDGRLVRMEEQMISLDDRTLDKKVRKTLQAIVDDKSVLQPDIVKLLESLEKCNSEVRHNYKAKYNHELNRYFKMFKSYNQMYEIYGKAKYRPFAELYSDLGKTYEIVNDQQFVESSRRNDKYIEILNNYHHIISRYVGIPLAVRLDELKKEITKTFGISPAVSTM